MSVALDSMSALFMTISDRALLRTELYRIAQTLKRDGMTVLFTSERIADYGDITRWGIAEVAGGRSRGTPSRVEEGSRPSRYRSRAVT